jgi:preprotein translocase subunit SecA
MPEQWDEVALNEALQQKVYPDECTLEITKAMLEKWDYEYAINKISKEVTKAYEEKIVNITKDTDGQVDYHQIERNELLRAVDRNWIDHIDAMDQLRKGIGLRGYAQQDPVIAYKQEGHEMFEEMIERIQTTTISRLLKGRIIKVPAAPQQIIQQRPVQQPAQKAQPAQSAPVKPINEKGDYVPEGTVIHRPKNTDEENK